MKTDFVVHRSRRNSSRALLVATLLVILIFAFDMVSGGVVRHAVQRFGAGVSQTASAAATSVASTGLFASRAALEAQNAALSQEVASYKAQAAYTQVLLDENTQLSAIAHLAAQDPGTTAPIVSSVISSPYGTFLIGAGSAEGVVRGAIALSPGGFVLGQVVDTGAHTATVSEVFAPTAVTDVTIHGSAAELTGEGGDALAKMPRDSVVAIGDSVYVPTLGARPAGIVGSIASSSSSAWQSVYVGLPESISSMQYVYVVEPRN